MEVAERDRRGPGDALTHARPLAKTAALRDTAADALKEYRLTESYFTATPPMPDRARGKVMKLRMLGLSVII
jgi:hypothetical protein